MRQWSIKLRYFRRRIYQSHHFKTQFHYLRTVVGYPKFPKTKNWFFWRFNGEVKLTTLASIAEAVIASPLGHKLNPGYLIFTDPQHNILKVVIAPKTVLDWRYDLSG
jgi:hypothetical protein